MFTSKKLILSFFVLLLSITTVLGQQEKNSGFGQNRVQHSNFDWYYYSSDKFDIYYYEGGRDYAKLALDYLNKEYNRITDIIGYAPFNKTVIFLYNSYTDLQQSNIGLDGKHFTIAGQTNFVKLQLEVAYPGSAQKFKDEITYKLTTILLDDMMFGGSLAERFQSAYLLSLANWFIDGAARYVTYGWSVEMDDYIRDYLSRKNLKKLSRLDEDAAGYVGQSVWNYISVKYGTGNISNILNLTRYTRKEESSIGSTLGLRFQKFVYDWQNYYLAASQQMNERYELPDREKVIASKNNPYYKFSQVRVNPAGNKIAYAVNYEGTYKVVVMDIESGKTNVILKGGYRVLTQESSFNIPLIDWLNDQTIGYIFDKSGIFYIGTYDLETKEKFEKTLRRFDQIHDFSFNYNGKLAILSANTDEHNDLYLISMRRNAIKRLTNDLFDDINPRFVPGTDAIVFSSNRTTKLLDEAKDVKKLGDLRTNLDLFIYDLDTTRNELFQVTNTIGQDFYPYPQNSETIYFLSDQKGNANLYRYDFRDDTYSQVTKFKRSIKEFDLNSINDEFTFLMLDGGIERIYLDKQFDLRQTNFTPFTPRQNILQARALVKRLEKREQEKAKKAQAEKTPDKDPLLPDSLMAKDDKPVVTDPAKKGSDEYKDADDFVFEEEAKFKNESLSFLSILGNLEAEPTIIGPLKYAPRFSMDNITTSFVIDPVRNFGIQLEAGMSDLLENHKLYGGAMFTPNLSQGDLFGEYNYLKHRVDFKLRVDRKVITFNPAETTLAQKYTLNSVSLGASYPLNNALRFSISPFYSFTNFSNLEQNFVIGQPGPAPFAANSRQDYIGFKSELVFDNTKILALNLYNGTRGKIQFSNYTGVSDAQRSFRRLMVDLRHYQKIHRELTFATRVYYNGFFGPNKQSNLLGGVDNWVFRGDDPVRPEGDRSVPPNYPFILNNNVDNTNILFTDVVTNLRGYNFGRLFGTQAFLFNAELRFPVFLYLTNGPIASNFLRNFQVVGFYDFGSSWTGSPPLDRENSVNTFRVDTDTQFDATIKNFRNPWLSSFGVGIRTVLLGYYVRLDMARPVENFEVGDRKFHLSIGYDF